MDRYGHLFPSEWDGLAERLDQMHRAALKGDQFGYQSDDENVVSLEKARVARANKQWGGLDLNQRPTDYESAALTD